MNLPDFNPKSEAARGKASTISTPPVAELAMGNVMALGARKYGRFNWRATGVASSVYYDAMRRHLAAWRDGEEIDPESGESHLAHVMACCAILLDARAQGVLKDDRHVAGDLIGDSPLTPHGERLARDRELTRDPDPFDREFGIGGIMKNGYGRNDKDAPR